MIDTLLSDIPISESEKAPGPAAGLEKADNCGVWAVFTECESCHKIKAKRIYCGKEWCPVCGQDKSVAHKRRIARVLKKAMQIEKLGYFVIEFPEIYRHAGRRGVIPDDKGAKYWCYSKKDLRDTTDIILKVMAGHRTGKNRRVGGYFKRGLVRWHWFGDKIPGKWNPHINILVDGEYIERHKLDEIKMSLRQSLNVPDLIVNYHYCNSPGQIYHSVEYVTRATFLDRGWNQYMVEELYNFRNQRWWGKWDDEPAWEIADISEKDKTDIAVISSFHDCKCPDCGGELMAIGKNKKTGQPIYWSKPIDSSYLIIWGAQEIGHTGYYRIDESSWHGSIIDPDDLLDSI